MTPEVEIKDQCFEVRAEIEEMKKQVFHLMKHNTFKSEQSSENQHGEMRANIMLAYRHLEDARMRLGKVVQAHDGGKSVYKK